MARKFFVPIQMVGGTVTGLPDPSAATDAVNLQTLQSFVRGMIIKDAVLAASTANVTIATPGASIDGVTLAAGNRVLLKDQSTGSQNGIYIWNGAAVPMTRATDADGTGGQGSELRGGSIVYVTSGTANGDKAFAITTPNADVNIGTDSMTWTQFGGGGTTYNAGNGLQLVGSTFSVLLDSASGLSVSGTGLKIDTGVVTRKYAQNIGNGSSTSIAVTHSLGTRDVTIAVFDNSTFETVIADEVRTDVNTVTLTFASAPANNAYRAVVMG